MSKLQRTIDKLLQSESLYSKKNLLIPLFLPASLVVILTIYVQLWYFFTPKPSGMGTIQPTQAPIVNGPTPTSRPTKSKTYHNPDLAFSFDYPDYVTVSSENNRFGSLLNLTIEDVQTNKMAQSVISYMNKYFYVSLDVYPQDPSNLPEQFATKLCTDITSISETPINQNRAICKQRVVSALNPYSNGVVEGYSGNVAGYGSGYFVILFNRDGNLYEFSSYGYEGTFPTPYSNQLLSEIIASIKFNRVDQAPKAFDGCVIGGCSSELCIDPKTDPTASICIYKTDYACLAYSTCERQNGKCGWRQTPQYLQCLQEL